MENNSELEEDIMYLHYDNGTAGMSYSEISDRYLWHAQDDGNRANTKGNYLVNLILSH